MSDPAKPRRGNKEDRRNAILQAARHELETVGYHGLNIRNVAKAADISLGLIYSYFANKEELFATLYAERLIAFQQQADSICQQNNDVAELMVALARAYLPIYQLFGRELNLFSVLKQPEQFSSDIRERLVNTAMSLMSQLYSHVHRLAQAEGVALQQVPQAPLMLPGMWIILNGLADHFSGERQHVFGHDLESMARFMAQTFWLGLKSQAASVPTTTD